jgi:hypothetical protein
MNELKPQCEAAQPRLSEQIDEAEGVAKECEAIQRILEKICDRLRGGNLPTPIGEKGEVKLPVQAHLVRLDQALRRSQGAQKAIIGLLDELEGMI